MLHPPQKLEGVFKTNKGIPTKDNPTLNLRN